MKSVVILILFATMNTVIFNFSNESDISNWRVVNDTVMGGVSNADFQLNEAGNGEFTGYVSLENNGGFSSVQYAFNPLKVSPEDVIEIRVKGDGKTYQFRVKDRTSTRHSYISEFTTTGAWQTLRIPLKNMYPQFRGQRLRRPNFDKDQIEQITFLIGNGKAQDFKLLIESIAIAD
ncbi:CIA30 family protein [Leeuwenhoekiella nanhaiensis]|uniref:CIA30 family protein n=1 Tax=Leeuwenhoekiella nanhaiensis TaxID=1655491 RepID=A0A2G1VQ60_9FLAO|nr:CIA30 family protein [Leeuwenhoekiella nanhaiensis]PHQ28609.1 CIA30 family protein [Leeuwenhoekiella nanhaiensis]